MTNQHVIVFGGYGTFGRLVCEELAARDVRVTVAGRNLSKARQFAETLGDKHSGIAIDLTDTSAVANAIADQSVVVNCAGPFSTFGITLLEACLKAGCHQVDLSDDRQYAASVRSMGAQLKQKKLAAVYGCSSLPGLSGCMAELARKRMPPEAKLAQIRCSLFIGNDNPKGVAAVTSASQLIGKEIQTRQGQITGFRDAVNLPLPSPFGRQTGMNFESPEYDLFPDQFGVESVQVKVSFESKLVCWMFRLAAKWAPKTGRWLMPRLAPLGSVMRFLGTSGGAVMSELFAENGDCVRATVLSKDRGQRMAIMPCVYSVMHLLAGSTDAGAFTAYQLIDRNRFSQNLIDDGYQVDIR